MWAGHELAAFGVRWVLVVLAVVGFSGFFGRRYRSMKKRIAELERQMERKESGLEPQQEPTVRGVVIHGGLQIIENHYNVTDGWYHAEVEGRGTIVSPVPVRLTASPMSIQGIGQSDLKLPSDISKTASETTLIRGIPELERCQQALVKYSAIPSERMVGSAHIAGSTELYPYMTDLCRVLDEQEIPHPEIDYDGLTIVDTGKWSRFLGELWAVRHDIERARRVYKGEGSRP